VHHAIDLRPPCVGDHQDTHGDPDVHDDPLPEWLSDAPARCRNGNQAAARASLQRTRLGTGSKQGGRAESTRVARFMRALDHDFMTRG
jgi:hypothetical protein